MLLITTLAMSTSAMPTGSAAQKANQPQKLRLLNGRLFINEKQVHEGFSVIRDHFRYLFFYIPSHGLFIISDAQFDGASRSGSFKGHTLSFRLDDVNVKVESSSQILSKSMAPAWVKFDPNVKLKVNSVVVGYGDQEKAAYDWQTYLGEN